MRELRLPVSPKPRFLFVACSALLLISVQCKAQESTHCPNPVYEAQRFLQVLYPEGTGHRFTVIFSVGGTYDDPWTLLPRLEVALLETNYTPSLQLFMGKEGQKMPLLEPKLTAYFNFDITSHLESVSITGDDLANDTKNMRVTQRVRSLPNSTLSQVAKILRQAGAKFGPEDKEAFLSFMPIQNLQQFLGPLSVKSAEFYIHGEQIGGTAIELRWIVEAEANGLDEHTHHYTLIFEPFSGKLISLRRAIEIHK